jgi:hypothetical protein
LILLLLKRRCLGGAAVSVWVSGFGLRPHVESPGRLGGAHNQKGLAVDRGKPHKTAGHFISVWRTNELKEKQKL